MTRDDMLKDLLEDIAEIDAPWDLITESTSKHILTFPEGQREGVIADFTIRISMLHALEAIAKGLAVIAQEDI